METNNSASQDNNSNEGSSTADEALSPEHTDILLQFQDLTRIDDLARCRSILESLNWNIEQAVRTYTFEDEEPVEIEPPSPPISLNQSSSNFLIDSDIRNRDPISSDRSSSGPSEAPELPEDNYPNPIEAENTAPISLFGGIYQLLSYPISLVYDTLIDIIRFTWNLIRPDPRRFVTDPVADVVAFVKKFESQYGLSHPVFYRGTYSAALADAKRELKFLLVYLHSEHHQDTADFCQSVLNHTEVCHYINRNNLLFWGCSVSSPEGYRVSQALRENTYPFLALIVLRDNRMTVVKRFEGRTSVERLLSQLEEAIVNSEGFLVAARADRQERDMNQQLRQEQDEAYQMSLKEDQEKEKRKKAEKLKQNIEEAKRLKIKQDESQKHERLLQMKLDLATKIPPEPAASDPNCIRIVIKLPDGSRLERKFVRTQSIRYLYYFVFCQDKSPMYFQITQNFPRKELPCKSPSIEDPECLRCSPDQNEPPSFDKIGLGKSEMLYVSDLEA